MTAPWLLIGLFVASSLALWATVILAKLAGDWPEVARLIPGRRR